MTPIDIQASPEGLIITWDNNQKQILNALKLRSSCNCANCVSEITGERTLKTENILTNIKLSGAEPMGR